MSAHAGGPGEGQELHGIAIADTSIRQPVFVTMVMLLLVVLGVLGYQALPVNYLPDISIATVNVGISYPSADPQTVVEQVTKPVENTLTTIPGVKTITSNSNEGSAQITVEFVDGVTPDSALQNVREKVNAIIPRLPDTVESPTFRQFDPNALPVLQVALASNGGLTPLQLRTLIDDSFSPQLQRVSGVGAVDVNGGRQRQINVLLDISRLRAYNLAPSQISNAIAAANTSIGLGRLDSGDETITLRAPSQISQPADIARIRIPGTRYRVGDVATIEDGVAEVTTYARLNGQDAVSLAVSKQSGTNTVEVVAGARATLDRLLKANPELISVITNDQSLQIKNAIDSSIEEIILAVLAAMLVVLLFFRDLRNTLVTVAGLPIILICTFGVMWLLGLTLNIYSLLALSLSVGLVIDDAIVVRENIFRYLERGDNPLVAASKGTAQVALSVLAMTLTIIAVFLPVGLVSGTTGVIFKTFGLTVAGAMALSLVEAFTFAPMLSANLFGAKPAHTAAPVGGVARGGWWQRLRRRFSRRRGAAPAGAAAGALEQPRNANTTDAGTAEAELGALGRGYGHLLRWSLRHRWIQVVATAAIFAVSLMAAQGLRFAFLPAQASDSFSIGFQLPPGSSVAKTDALARQAERLIQADPGVRAVQAVVGSGGGPESGSLTVRLKSSKQVNAVRARLTKQLAFLPQLTFSTQSFRGGGTGVTSRNVQVQLQSARSLDELRPIAAQVQQLMQQTDGFSDVGSSYSDGRPELRFEIDGARAADVGLTGRDVGSSLRALISGDTATTWQQAGDDIPVVVRLPAGQRARAEDLRAISIPTSAGRVALADVARLGTGVGPTSIRRSDRLNQIVVGANVVPGGDQNALERQLQGQLNGLKLPADVYVSFGGATRDQQQGFSGLFAAMGLSILFVYMVLASQFASFTQPLIIMLAMPFSFLGAFVALRLTGRPLDISGIIGLIMLLGLVVKNSILLVDFANRLRAEGLEVREALAQAGAVRLRPILMTSIAIIAGALPTALGIHFFSSGEGSEFRVSLAVVLIGGMLTSTLLTLLVVPTAYSLLASAQRRLSSLRRWRPQVVTQPSEAASTLSIQE